MMDFMPLTFHIRDGSEDPEFKKFELEFQASLKRNKNSLWIVKPGENSNRGNGISVCSMIS